MSEYPGRIYLVDQNLEMGVGTNIKIRPEPKGFLGLNVTNTDQEIVGIDGSVGGPESYQSRILTIPITIFHGDPEQARRNLQSVLNSWQLIRTGTTALEVTFPGQPEEVITYYGRPREIVEGNMRRAAGWYELDLNFDALDPFGYGEEITIEETSTSPLEFDNPGNASSSWANIRVNGEGGADLFTLVNNSTYYDGDILSGFSLAVSQYVDLDIYNMSAIKNGTTNYDNGISVLSKWFEIVPGHNSIAFTDCDSISMTYRPAYF